jgi:hypothetical protein
MERELHQVEGTHLTPMEQEHHQVEHENSLSADVDPTLLDSITPHSSTIKRTWHFTSALTTPSKTLIDGQAYNTRMWEAQHQWNRNITQTLTSIQEGREQNAWTMEEILGYLRID